MTAIPKIKEEPHYTYADYKEWELDEGERFEIIDGEAFMMSSPGERHQAILGELFNQLYNFLRGKPCKVYPAPFDVRLFYEEDESDDVVVQPDIMVICDKNKLVPEGVRGAPDLVIEILSPSNSAIYMCQKLRIYQEAGVREYWVVNPDSKEITVYLFGRSVNKNKIYKNSDVINVTVLPGLSIPLEQVFV